MFIDKINLTLLSGSGGSGSISYSSKSSKTSPNGASGGKGGSIILKTNKKLFDLSHIFSKSIFKAENGGDASKNLQSGKNANDLIISITSRGNGNLSKSYNLFVILLNTEV